MLKIQLIKIAGQNGILKLLANILFIRYKVNTQTMGLSGRVHRGAFIWPVTPELE